MRTPTDSCVSSFARAKTWVRRGKREKYSQAIKEKLPQRRGTALEAVDRKRKVFDPILGLLHA